MAKRLPAYRYSLASGPSSSDGGSAGSSGSSDENACGAVDQSDSSSDGYAGSDDGCGDSSGASSNDAGCAGSDGAVSKRKRTPGVDIQLGLVLDKQLCFHGVTSLAVLGDEPIGLELALAALTVAMRETHRCSNSTILWQLSPLLPCPLVPQPPPGSFLFHLMRVPRPLQLPSPRFKMLLSDAESNASALTHAVVWRLIHGLGCASVLIRGSEGVSTALQAVARACNTLNKLYQLDCVVYMAWKSPPPAAAAAAAAAGEASRGMAESGISTRSAHTDSSSGSSTVAGHQQQNAAAADPAVLPNRLYKLVVMSCDMSDPLSGWKHLGPGRRAHQVQQQQDWLLQAQQRQQARMKRPRWYRPRRKPQSSQEPPS